MKPSSSSDAPLVHRRSISIGGPAHALSLLIVKMLALPGRPMPNSARSLTFEFWRDQNKIRGRFIGIGHVVVAARLNADGFPEQKDPPALTSAADEIDRLSPNVPPTSPIIAMKDGHL